MKTLIPRTLTYLFIACFLVSYLFAQTATKKTLLVRKCGDFSITGDGSNTEWDKADWIMMSKVDTGGSDYKSKFKIMASAGGIYVLFWGEDNKITTKDYDDFDKIWNGDVFEVFFHPDPQQTMYYEYEVNQFGKQIVLAISNSKNGLPWTPFDEYDNKKFGIENKVQISGGARELDSPIKSWSAEVFLSFKSIGLMPLVPPKSGTVWDANFCRLDHDSGRMVKWSWTPAIERSLHELDKFYSIKFE
jgi:Carbohydrate family 9 binding domain-like